MFRSKKNSPYSFIIALVLGVVLAVGGSVWATSVGTNVSVTGTLTVSSATASSSITTALGVATTTPTTALSIVGSTYTTLGLGAGIATTTAGALEITGPAALGGALSVTGASTLTGATTLSGAATLSSTLAVTGLSTLTGGVLTNNATSTIRNLNMVTSTSTSATSTSLYASGQFKVGSNGTNIASVMHGFCAFGPIVASQSIVASTTGTVACTTEVPSGLAAGDKVWLTASTTASGVVGGSVIYTGIASSTATDRIQGMVFNGTGAAWTVTTSTWQYLIVK